MTKLLRLLQYSRNSFGKSIDGRDASRLHALSFQAGISTARVHFTEKERIFAPYSVFKGKAALSVSPVLPTFTKLDSGHLTVQRRGSLMLTFMPAIGERKYDYSRRQCFALSATEVGSLISLGPKDSSEFFHDPSMLSSNAGQVRKSLSIKPHADGGGYFLSLTVANNVLKTNDWFSVPLTAGEFTVLKTACSFVLPHIMGWDRLTAKLPGYVVGNPPKADRLEPELEWAR
ncbi:hypothetical protein JCGZ_14839 [Jatropha curcas]|uniref:Uncharacterized protein n=1 Tax=Jatropha curcas TaxID=180498 RepID=A0A067KIF3_JATCU|nr:single-stranded DNA-binding protein WHY2, mitochondrial isoform X1 [Jatropha curcas]XP_037497072.1 single-stranded DNA-binding protein WHY2, mitochondrial isoform X2 [Jatropha curcas]KDP31614.1 hypothetical protein JCGZ_14839 [Jatropha curcas]